MKIEGDLNHQKRERVKGRVKINRMAPTLRYDDSEAPQVDATRKDADRQLSSREERSPLLSGGAQEHDQ